ncbi:EAL domain-containing protein [Carboxydothermus hydrogenoformans]|uniref:EAL domain protein n=1 Tax=Carboxydothermus hydrogenoformans (strain ATCC BAA-161 / DSM 6008 / Z-2901) TaxID=246194 RepID=Q3AFY8_CARHZ|nr:EAL domain-containing protein [Carboxydothermus hydrogenoformans]ABB14624.1 EAL domain protein [Carboxydothermus hydrogenoformans Z-2901]
MSPTEKIVPFFQPVFSVNTFSVLGYEVLARKITPQGIESLGAFFHDPQVPPENKIKVDRFVRRRALELFKQSNKNLRLFLNIQPQWLYPFISKETNFPTLEYLDEYGISADRVIIEISETEFSADYENLSRLIDRYRKAGCQIAVDDVGRGFNNLERIIAIRPDFLKVDTQLVRRSIKENMARNLLETLGSFAEKSGLGLILEGIESAELFRLGLEIGACYYQGFFIACPAPHLTEAKDSVNFIKQEVEDYIRNEIHKRNSQYQRNEELNKLMKNFNFSNIKQSLEEKISNLIQFLPDYCFRVYACDCYGYQRTPNFTRNLGGGWTVSGEYLNRNWSWRPYFFRGVTTASQLGRGISSEPYIDLETKLKVWTFCYDLGDNLYLFIDCLT